MIKGKSLLKKIIIVILLIIFIYSGIQLVIILLEYKQGEEIYETANYEYVLSTEPAIELAPVPEIDFKALKALNEDVAGWIWIEDSQVNYPLLKGRDNQHYLTHTYDGTYNKLGSIFIDYRTVSEFDAQNTIIYGHNMKTDDMFGTLEKYKDSVYYQAHKYIYILREGKTIKYEIFSGYVTDAYGDTYTINFLGPGEYYDYLVKMKGQSLIETDVEVNDQDKIITLSTCTSTNEKRARFVIQAKQIK